MDSKMVPTLERQPLSVLVIDDYPDAASSLAQILAFEGFAARTAQSGAAAMLSLAAERSDVVVFEPRTIGCGWEIARRITDPGRLPTLLVAYTTDTTNAGRCAAQVAGVGSYVIKPEDPTVLVDIMRQFEQSEVRRLPVVSQGTQRVANGHTTDRSHNGSISALVLLT